MDLSAGDIVLCKFYFSDLKKSKQRPVFLFKDNLPHDDFIAIPISSQISKMYEDELLLTEIDFQQGSIPKDSKLMLRKTFVVSKKAALKKYGTLSFATQKRIQNLFCQYFHCA